MTFMTEIQRALRAVYPARCLACGAVVDSDFGLCGPCWRDTAFIGGVVCDGCGAPLPGEAESAALTCDDCLKDPRPWRQGRAALLYKDTGRKLVLALKHGDRQEIAQPAALWMADVLRDILPADTLIAPIPLHWSRMLARRYNQSALLARALAQVLHLPFQLDLLQRHKRTPSLDHKSRALRFETLRDAISLPAKSHDRVAGKHILLVDDVMTSGATFSAATEAVLQAGAATVRVVALARVTKDT